MRQVVAAFAGLMERKLSENDHKGGWSNDSPAALLKRLKEELKELEDELVKPTVNASVAAFEAVDVANFAMMIVDRLTGGKMSTLPSNLAALPRATKPAVTQGVKASGGWFRWLITCQGEDARVMSGKLYASDGDNAMVQVRAAAVADGVARPFEVTIARIFRINDETIQKTHEKTHEVTE